MTCEFPWSQSSSEVLKALNTNPISGLPSEEVLLRRQHFGTNAIQTQGPPSVAEVFFRQFKSLLAALLAVAAGISFITQDHLDGIAIILVLLINALIGFVTEYRAISSMESLKKLGRNLTRVLRSGAQDLVDSEQLVPGDIIILEAGDLVTADARLTDSHNLTVDESSLTGESVPVEKSVCAVIAPDTSTTDRTNMIMKGTHVTRGVCTAVVTHTGMNSELGKIAHMTSQGQDEITPLEKRLDHLGKRLVWLTLIIAIAVFVSGALTGKALGLMLQTAIALAVATVPEGLPIVATIALAKGVWLMAKRNALINRLSAVETLGATSLIVTDKTGTLTENKMTVVELALPGGSYHVNWKNSETLLLEKRDAQTPDPSESTLSLLSRLLSFCNDAEIQDDGDHIGDPMEVALLNFAHHLYPGAREFRKNFQRTYEVPFDSETKMMATAYNVENNQCLLAVKGAPEIVIDACSRFSDGTAISEADRKAWIQKNQLMAEQGLRVLAVAHKTDFHPAKNSVYKDLCFDGLVGLIDPPRKDVASAIALCQRAGIKVVMATGDQAGTAGKIASDIGLSVAKASVIAGSELRFPVDDSPESSLQNVAVFSRVSPEQKLQIVGFLQGLGNVVAMTGDGVNDAPALRKADIGIAMGIRGTQVAREASDMVLKDDRFETIVHAVHQGRVIFENIRKFVIYLLSCNLSEVLIVGLAALLTTSMPITPVQILFLNLVTDVFPALALGMGSGDQSCMLRPPRGSSERVLESRHWKFIVSYGSLITVVVLALYYLCLNSWSIATQTTITMCFLTLGLSQVLLVFNLRNRGSGFFVNEITSNKYVWGAVLLCLMIFAGAMNIDIVRQALSLSPLSLAEWAIVLAASSIPLLGQLFLHLD